MAEIDLANQPAKMFTAADNAKDYTFYIVKEMPQYTARAFEWNPNVAAGADIYFKSPMTPDDAGRALADLEKNSKQIIDKLKDVKTPARAVVVATSKPKNRDPRKRQSVVQRVTLIAPKESIKLKPIKDRVSKADWIAHHHAIIFIEATIRGVPQIQFELEPKTAWPNTPCVVGAVYENDAPGSLNVKRMIMGGIGDVHAPNPKCPFQPQHHANWGQLWGTQQTNGMAAITVNLPTPSWETYVFALYPRYPGNFVLTVKGTGPHAKLTEKHGAAFTGPHSNPGD